MAIVVDIKKDREAPQIGDEVEIAEPTDDRDVLTITKVGDFRCYMRLRLTPSERLFLIRHFLTK